VSADVDPITLAAEIGRARAAGRTLPVPFSARDPLTLAEAYAVQHEVTAARLARGERIVGWKLGYTSEVMREQMGIDAPNFGPLTDAMLLANGAAVPATALQPRVEPEIGLRFARPVPLDASIPEILDACDGAYACLEVVDSVWRDYRFTLEDNTADGSSAAWVVVGPELPLDDLAGIEVELSVDGASVATGRGADADGHPAAGAAWLAQQLATHDRAIEPGDLVITGGLTRAVPLPAEGWIRATFHVAGHLLASVDVRHRGSTPRPIRSGR